jgi:hypothetical protein
MRFAPACGATPARRRRTTSSLPGCPRWPWRHAASSPANRRRAGRRRARWCSRAARPCCSREASLRVCSSSSIPERFAAHRLPRGSRSPRRRRPGPTPRRRRPTIRRVESTDGRQSGRPGRAAPTGRRRLGPARPRLRCSELQGVWQSASMRPRVARTLAGTIAIDMRSAATQRITAGRTAMARVTVMVTVIVTRPDPGAATVASATIRVAVTAIRDTPIEGPVATHAAPSSRTTPTTDLTKTINDRGASPAQGARESSRERPAARLPPQRLRASCQRVPAARLACRRRTASGHTVSGLIPF